MVLETRRVEDIFQVLRNAHLEDWTHRLWRSLASFEELIYI